MRPNPQDHAPFPSLLDQLVGPTGSASVSRWSSDGFEHRATASLLRDIENLLNTRSRCESGPAHLVELQQSVIDYGLPDLGRWSFGSAEARERLRQLIERTLRTYEPRIADLAVRQLPFDDPLHVRFDLDFRIVGTRDQQLPMAVVFSPDSSQFSVTEG